MCSLLKSTLLTVSVQIIVHSNIPTMEFKTVHGKYNDLDATITSIKPYKNWNDSSVRNFNLLLTVKYCERIRQGMVTERLHSRLASYRLCYKITSSYKGLSNHFGRTFAYFLGTTCNSNFFYFLHMHFICVYVWLQTIWSFLKNDRAV